MLKSKNACGVFKQFNWYKIINIPALSRFGSATTFLPSFTPGRYLTFSCHEEQFYYIIIIEK
jgi:hypothetical protein